MANSQEHPTSTLFYEDNMAGKEKARVTHLGLQTPKNWFVPLKWGEERDTFRTFLDNGTELSQGTDKES